MQQIGKIQIGKQGITENFISNLKTGFTHRKNIKVHILQNAGHDREKVKEYTSEIQEKLGKNYAIRRVGFIINIKKLRKDKDE